MSRRDKSDVQNHLAASRKHFSLSATSINGQPDGVVHSWTEKSAVIPPAMKLEAISPVFVRASNHEPTLLHAEAEEDAG